MPGAPSLELFQMRMGKALENRLKCYNASDPLVHPPPIRSGISHPKQRQDMSLQLVANVHAYIVVLGLQMHCYGPNRKAHSFAPTFLCLAWGTPKPLQLSMNPKVDAGQGLSGSLPSAPE